MKSKRREEKGEREGEQRREGEYEILILENFDSFYYKEDRIGLG